MERSQRVNHESLPPVACCNDFASDPSPRDHGRHAKTRRRGSVTPLRMDTRCGLGASAPTGRPHTGRTLSRGIALRTEDAERREWARRTASRPWE